MLLNLFLIHTRDVYSLLFGDMFLPSNAKFVYMELCKLQIFAFGLSLPFTHLVFFQTEV